MFMIGPMTKAAADSDDKNEPEDNLAKGMLRSVKVMAALDLRGTLQPTARSRTSRFPRKRSRRSKELGGAAKEEDILKSDMATLLLANLVLPTESVAKGKTWSKKIETKVPLYKTIAEDTFTFEGPAEKDGVKVERISIKSSLKLEADSTAKLKVQLKDFKGPARPGSTTRQAG